MQVLAFPPLNPCCVVAACWRLGPRQLSDKLVACRSIGQGFLGNSCSACGSLTKRLLRLTHRCFCRIRRLLAFLASPTLSELVALVVALLHRCKRAGWFVLGCRERLVSKFFPCAVQSPWLRKQREGRRSCVQLVFCLQGRSVLHARGETERLLFIQPNRSPRLLSCLPGSAKSSIGR